MLSSLVAPLAIERLHGHENEVAIAFVDSVTRRQLKSKRGIDVQGDMTHRESHLPRLCSYDKEEYFLCSSVPCDDEDDEGPCDESPPHHQLLLWGENGTGYDDLLPKIGPGGGSVGTTSHRPCCPGSAINRRPPAASSACGRRVGIHRSR